MLIPLSKGIARSALVAIEQKPSEPYEADVLNEVTFSISAELGHVRKIAALTNFEIQDSLEPGFVGLSSDNKEDKPLLLMVHGWLDNAASFMPLIPLLNKFRVIAIDLPGHGKSTHRSDDAHYHLTDYVQDLHELVLSQNWSTFFLLGHSLGGIISSIYCAAFPERVKKFVCIESAGPLTEPEDTSAEQIRASIISRIETAKKNIKQPLDLNAIVEARLKVGDLSYENAQAILMRNTNNPLSADIEWATDKKLRTKSTMRFTEPQAINILQSIKCPIHFVLGSNGFEKVKALIEKRKASLPEHKLSTFTGGHHVHMEAHDELAGLVTDYFLSDL